MGAETGERDLYNDCGSYKERDPLGNPRNNKAFIRLHAVQRLVMHKIDIEIMRAQVSPASGSSVRDQPPAHPLLVRQCAHYRLRHCDRGITPSTIRSQEKYYGIKAEPER
jgi:hypothetical protein